MASRPKVPGSKLLSQTVIDIDRRHAGAGRWRFDADWAAIDGRAEVVAFHIGPWPHDPNDPPIPMTSTLLKSLNIGSAIDESRSGWADALLDLAGKDKRWRTARNAYSAPTHHRGGRPPASINELEVAAEAFRVAHANGKPTHAAVAKASGLSLSGAAKKIRQARDAGLIPETKAKQTTTKGPKR